MRKVGSKKDHYLQKGRRIAQVIARAGLCSRREAECWIAHGRVMVDGVVLDSPAFTVTLENRIRVDGEALPQEEKVRLWRYHKPAGLIVSHKDPQGRSSVFDALPDTMPRVMSVGRLDLNSEGLLLLSTDGALARYLEHPKTGWRRRYRVRVRGRVDNTALESLKNGITVEGIRYGPIEAMRSPLERGAEKKVEKSGKNTWLDMTLREGKNREIRRVLGALGLEVSRLIRISYGPFLLGNLARGLTEEVPAKMLQSTLPKEYGI